MLINAAKPSTKEIWTCIKIRELSRVKGNTQICGADINRERASKAIESVRTTDPKHDRYTGKKIIVGRPVIDDQSVFIKENVKTMPPEFARIESQQLGLYAVDQGEAKPLWLTVAMDVISRSILGMYISFTPPDDLTVEKSLRHNMKPKTYVKRLYPHRMHAWDANSTPVTLTVDSKEEFHSRHLRDFCRKFGISLKHVPPYASYCKGVIERLLYPLDQLLRSQLDTAFPSVGSKDNDSPNNAVIDLETLEELLHKYIIDVYQQKQRVRKAISGTYSKRKRTKHVYLRKLMQSHYDRPEIFITHKSKEDRNV